MKDKLRKILCDSIQIKDIDIELTRPKNKVNGDYSTNIALKLTKILNKNPIDIAYDIVNNIKKDEDIIDIKIENPGFINFYLSNKYILNNINTINENPNYGSNNYGNNLKVNLEYVSANPTGYLHLGHARSAFYGSSLANIMKYCGYNVTSEYYINDAGNQINNLVNSIQLRYNQLCGSMINEDDITYHGEEIKTIASYIYDKYQDKLPNIETLKDFSVEFLLNKIKNDLSKTKVEFDVWTSEKSLYTSNKVEQTLNMLKNSDYTYTLDNALYLKTTSFFDDKDRVIIKSDNEPTYLLPDIAYHVDKYKRGYNNIINILGADHHGYIARLKSSMEILGYDSSKMEIKILQLVKLIKDNQELKMSKRSGTAITINDLIEMVGLTAARYYMVSKSLDSKMDLDLDAITKESNDNPIFYIEYAYARINSILKDKDILKENEYTTIEKTEAIDLLKHLYDYEDTLVTAAKNREVHILTKYLYDLASLFHSYYNSEKFVTEDEKFTNERLNLLKSVQTIIYNGLNLIGITPREKM